VVYVLLILDVSIHAPAQGATASDPVSVVSILFQSTPPRRGRLGGVVFSEWSLMFQSTPPRRGRLPSSSFSFHTNMFQSTPPRRGRLLQDSKLTVPGAFQSTPPRRGRRGFNKIKSERWSFNPRPRAGGDEHHGEGLPWYALFQSTPPRRGRLPSAASLSATGLFQSTPPRRGRPIRTGTPRSSPSFQSTPPRRGRRSLWASIRAFWRFQSTPPRRGRRDRPRERQRVHRVSIHAPAQGATQVRGAPAPLAAFQSTPPRRGRLGTSASCRDRTGFNPRPRAGGDPFLRWPACYPSVSIHAPAQGATIIKLISGYQRKFQSTPPRRGRPYSSVMGAYITGFNPRPRAGGDRGRDPRPPGAGCFNPRPRAGGDHLAPHLDVRLDMFQSTPPRRGRLKAHHSLPVPIGVSIHAPAQGAT